MTEATPTQQVDLSMGRPMFFNRVDTSYCEEYFEQVERFAHDTGRLKQFYERIEQLCSNGDTVRLFQDFAPHSFEFVRLRNGEHVYNGGLIFHGPHDGGGNGGAPTFSVSLTPQDGWSIHT